jgi:hypothetical protein
VLDSTVERSAEPKASRSESEGPSERAGGTHGGAATVAPPSHSQRAIESPVKHSLPNHIVGALNRIHPGWDSVPDFVRRFDRRWPSSTGDARVPPARPLISRIADDCCPTAQTTPRILRDRAQRVSRPRDNRSSRDYGARLARLP